MIFRFWAGLALLAHSRISRLSGPAMPFHIEAPVNPELATSPTRKKRRTTHCRSLKSFNLRLIRSALKALVIHSSFHPIIQSESIIHSFAVLLFHFVRMDKIRCDLQHFGWFYGAGTLPYITAQWPSDAIQSFNLNALFFQFIRLQYCSFTSYE